MRSTGLVGEDVLDLAQLLVEVGGARHAAGVSVSASYISRSPLMNFTACIVRHMVSLC